MTKKSVSAEPLAPHLNWSLGSNFDFANPIFVYLPMSTMLQRSMYRHWILRSTAIRGLGCCPVVPWILRNGISLGYF